jgi:parvulin-like peptidyl-prolyl isomerase
MSLTTMRRKFKRAERWIQWVLVTVFVVGCFSFFGGYTMQTRAQTEDEVVARVNGKEIPRDVYNRALQMNQDRMRMSGSTAAVTPEQVIQMRAAAFDMAENDALRLQMADQMGVRVSDSQARAEQTKMVQRFLADKLNGATPDEKRDYEEKAKAQLFPLEGVKNQLMAQGLEQKLRDQTKPTDADLMKSYQEYKTRHILIKTDTRPDAEARRRGEEVLGKIKAGVAFEDLARKYSEDTASKTKGGDLGWVGAKTGFVPEFKEALFKLNKGEVSPLVKSQFGYHIIKVDDIRSNVPKDINKPGKKAQYLKEYTDQLLQEKFQQMMQTARKDAKVEAIDPFVKGYLAENDMIEAQQKGNMPLANAKRAAAIAGYEQAAVGRSGGPPIYTKLAELYQASNQDQKAVTALQKALSAQANPQMAWQLGELLMKQKKSGEALVAYQKAADGATDMPWLRPTIAQRIRDLKRPDLAAKEQAKWEQFQKTSKNGGTQIRGPGGQLLQVEHTQSTVSPAELKKMKKEGKAPVTVKTEAK